MWDNKGILTEGKQLNVYIYEYAEARCMLNGACKICYVSLYTCKETFLNILLHYSTAMIEDDEDRIGCRMHD